jgi:hypothetical protein
MPEEVRAIELEDASILAEEAGEWLGRLGDSLVGAHRHRLMAAVGLSLATIVATSCDHLAAECDESDSLQWNLPQPLRRVSLRVLTRHFRTPMQPPGSLLQHDPQRK